MPVTTWPDDEPLFGGGAQIYFGFPKLPAAPAIAANRKLPLLGKRFDDALAYASTLHRKQLRKGTTIPYLSHLLGVAALALEMNGDEDQAIAALLHDAVEDQGGVPLLDEISKRFGARVAGIVSDCTQWDVGDDDGIAGWRARRVAYIDSLSGKSQDSLLVVLADKTHNVRTLLDDLHARGVTVWDRFFAGREGTLWYYAALAEVFDRIYPGPASHRFKNLADRLVRDF